ncbi:ABC-three component system middle component 6 [Draconibacterium orientale]|uniref:ABC-three component system middle component 6 n=1 Tax=Draconibacterium orientale TaxID=1168034 RepID=UPI002A0A67CC|nr:ABC-three component system middle component 6 [Draconibacterium orientale]
MIISSDIHPQKKVYYIGALIIQELKQLGTTEFDFFNLYAALKEKENISMNLFSLSLDWLFLLGAIDKKKNKLIVCF